MAGKPTRAGDGEFEHKPLAALARLRAQLPSAPADTEALAPPALGGPTAPAPASNTFGAKLVVQRERKQRGGKTVTRIRGLEGDAAARAQLARELAKALGCGSSVDDGDIRIQGAQVARAADWLERRGASRVVRGN